MGRPDSVRDTSSDENISSSLMEDPYVQSTYQMRCDAMIQVLVYFRPIYSSNPGQKNAR
jgi:hypothetical protein